MIPNRLKKLRPSILEFHNNILKGEISVKDICRQSLNLIKETEHLNSFVTLCDRGATAYANQLDREIADKGSIADTSQLFGIPISIKDNFCTNGLLTTCGSKMLYNFVPPYDATVVAKLKKAKCLIMGKTNMDEFAMGSSSLTSYFGPTANYYHHESLGGEKPDLTRHTEWFMAGGSSTGSAVSVASGSCLASLGTDTGGSTRQPASFTGTVGFKPSYGLISRHGLIPLVHCLDVVSLLARHPSDVRILFDILVGLDEHDLTTVDHHEVLVNRFKDWNIQERLKICIGVPESFISDGDVSSDVGSRFSEVTTKLVNLSNRNIEFKFLKLDLDSSKLSTECYSIISTAEIASNMSCYDGVRYGFSVDHKDDETFNRDDFYRANRDGGFGDEVKKRILMGNYFLLGDNRTKYLEQSQKVRRLISDEFDQAFKDKKVDIILTPSTPTTCMPYKEWICKQDSNKLFHQDYFLIPANLANRPSISIPCGDSASDGRPIGLQLIADKYHDLDLLLIAGLIQDLLAETFVMKSHDSSSREYISTSTTAS